MYDCDFEQRAIHMAVKRISFGILRLSENSRWQIFIRIPDQVGNDLTIQKISDSLVRRDFFRFNK